MIVEVLDAIGRRIVDPDLLDLLGAGAESLVIKNIKSGSWAPNSALTQNVKGNNRPLQDRGGLLGSIAHRVENGKAITSTNHVAAVILHYGGTIRPRTAKYLTIPAGANTRMLQRKYGFAPRAMMDGMKAAGWRVWPYFGSGHPVILASYKSQVPICIFILKRSVTIPARKYMSLTPEGRIQLVRMAQRKVFA
jgi:phage gpG-like protein